jgi:two-component sensor histidine kinase
MNTLKSSTSPPISAAAKMLLKQPDSCLASVRSAIALYEEELERRRKTEAKLHEALVRENALLASKDELIRQKDILSTEFEHRFLNGMQMITSLLVLQSRAAKNAEAAAQLAIAANRVATLVRIHRHLHTLDNVESVEFRGFLEKLCIDLADMASRHSDRPIFVESTELRIPTVIAIPLGFIACELLTNSLKYAKGKIAVRLQGTPDGMWTLSISDDGPGVPQDFDLAVTTGLGMKLIAAWVKQIGGELDIAKGDGGQGTRFTVHFALSLPTCGDA